MYGAQGVVEQVWFVLLMRLVAQEKLVTPRCLLCQEACCAKSLVAPRSLLTEGEVLVPRS